MGTFFELPPEYQGQAARIPTEQEKMIQEEFVRQYLVDYDPRNALIRVGFSAECAQEYVLEYMTNSFVLRRIQEEQKALYSKDKEELATELQSTVLSGLLREANYQGHGSSAAARVQALARVSAMLGIDAPVKQEIAHTGGVIVVPGTSDINDWEKVAIAQQESSKAAVK